MCGIAGQVSKTIPINQKLVATLTLALAHRGPDDEGLWFSVNNTVGLGHRRLSILDLSPLGRQPMHSPDGRFTIVFNGEIYNFQELRKDLEQSGDTFISTGDTEVLLRLWCLYGPDSLTKLRGMFAFAIWDDREKQLWLTRDPLGIKPLYYSENNDTLTFASEVKALKAAGIASAVSPQGVGAFLKWGSIPPPLSFYESVNALPAASVLCWQQQTGAISLQSYWDYDQAWNESQNLVGGIKHRQDAVEWVRTALLDSVRAHLVSDVPVGAFLSGGIDSTAVVSLMRQAGQQEIETFSITFDDRSLDESQFSNQAATHYQTKHHSWQVTQSDFLRLRSDFFSALDQPTIDGLNTFFVSRLAHEHGLKVVTSGVGGDELFRGYSIFKRLPKIKNLLPRTPTMMRLAGASMLEADLLRNLGGHKTDRLVGLLRTKPELNSLYLWSRKLFQPQQIRRLLTDSAFAEVAATVDMTAFLPDPIPSQASLQTQISMYENSRFLGSQLLADSDSFSMAHSLELRVPLVDRLLFEQVIAFPDAFFHNGNGTPKSLLVDAVGDLPGTLVYRTKRTFTLPFVTWLRESPAQLSNSLLNRVEFERVLQEFQANKVHWSRIWALQILDQAVMK